MNYHILTLFPEMVMDGLNTSIIGRAVEKGLISIEAINIRDYSVPSQLRTKMHFKSPSVICRILPAEQLHNIYRSRRIHL